MRVYGWRRRGLKLSVSFGGESLMITVSLTMDEARAIAAAICELVERDERNEPILGPINWEALGAASNKLTAAIGKAA
jgi:hypothetical protein